MPDWSGWPFSAEDPYPAYHLARARAPVQWHERLGAHLVLSHEHASAVLRSPEWSSDPPNSPQLVAHLGGAGPVYELWSRSLLTSDPATHTRLRAAVGGFFTPRVVARIRACVATIVNSAFAMLADGEPIEVMRQLAYPIPLAVLAELFDLGVEETQLLCSATPKIAPLLELDPAPEELADAGTAALTLMLFLIPLVARRRGHPGEDLLSALIHPAGSAALSTEEIITMCLLLLAAGHEASANLIGNGVVALLENRHQLDWLERHPDRCAQAVNELLRYDCPVQVVSRVARSDLVLDQTTVSSGERALVVLGAANRDPDRHPLPDRLDLTRSAPRHLAFGSGLHYCVGAALAQLEAQEIFNRLAQSALRPSAGGWSYSRDPSRTLRRLEAIHVSATQSSPVEQSRLELSPAGLSVADR